MESFLNFLWTSHGEMIERIGMVSTTYRGMAEFFPSRILKDPIALLIGGLLDCTIFLFAEEKACSSVALGIEDKSLST
jgi:hypothetical protein